jgi:ferric-dicitrate binding protein FerR (iron transport regulator)
MKKSYIHPDKEWEELASMLSGEKNEEKDLINSFEDDDVSVLNEHWKEMRYMNNNDIVDVDKAWNKVLTRIQTIHEDEKPVRKLNAYWLRIAATAILLIGIGTAVFYSGMNTREIMITTTSEQRNVPVDLPDGSKIYLNHNSSLAYRADLGKASRKVRLSGEAFFQITPDVHKPFIIDAGKAEVKVVGTSFNVITDNYDASVEVFVKTGKVILADKEGEKSITLDPGFIGKMNAGKAEKTENSDPNYMAWNTGILDYKGQKLENVFRDLKRIYNMDIVADDPSILENTWSSYIDNQPQDKIILLICTSFNLSYTKEGNVYHLAGK